VSWVGCVTAGVLGVGCGIVDVVGVGCVMVAGSGCVTVVGSGLGSGCAIVVGSAGMCVGGVLPCPASCPVAVEVTRSSMGSVAFISGDAALVRIPIPRDWCPVAFVVISGLSVLGRVVTSCADDDWDAWADSCC
jgi:hypothetical protein